MFDPYTKAAVTVVRILSVSCQGSVVVFKYSDYLHHSHLKKKRQAFVIPCFVSAGHSPEKGYANVIKK